MRRALIGAWLAACLTALPAGAQSGVTGNWSGTYSYSVQSSACSRTFTANGNASMTLLQTGTSISGRIDLADFLSFTAMCTATTAEVTRAVVGSVSGSEITWTVPNTGPRFTGSIDPNAITASWTDAGGGTGSITLTRTGGAAPAVDVTGEWSGNYSFTDRCSNGATRDYSGDFTFGLRQAGANAGGVVTMKGVPLYDENCRTLASLDIVMTAAGIVSGSTFTGGVFDPSGSFEFPTTVTVDSASMSGTVAGASQTDTTGIFTLTRTSSATPAANFAGSYKGSYAESDNLSFICSNIGRLNFAGQASLTIVQAGSVVSGWLIFHDAADVISNGFGGCAVVSVGDVVMPVYGTLAGNAVTLILPIGGGAIVLFEVIFDGDAVSGTINDSFGDTASFDAIRTAAPTMIDSFVALPSEIAPGQSATLSWSTSNATTVSIDNGVGTQATSGSVTVSPTQTTVYTLTATGPDASQTAKATVTVLYTGPKRRSVRR